MTAPRAATPGEVPDAELMHRLAGGDMRALETLVTRHQDRIRALAYRITSHWEVADDVAQEAFLRLYRAAPRWEPTAALSTWLYRICVNLCLDRARRRRSARQAEVPAPPPAAPADDALIRRERAEAVRREIAQLPERQRVAVILHRFEGLSHPRIAELTGWSESAVESLLVRAYAQLRSRLKSWAGS